MKRVPDLHTLKSQHLLSRSYLPSAAGQAAFYQVVEHMQYL